MTLTESFWLKAVSRPGRVVFAIMFALESFARALLATIIPLQAYALLQSARDVSLLNTLVAIAGLVSSFAIPFLIRRFRRRWVYTAGLVSLMVAAGLLATHVLLGQVGGMLLRAFEVIKELLDNIVDRRIGQVLMAANVEGAPVQPGGDGIMRLQVAE